jgi:hypothetical protein
MERENGKGKVTKSSEEEAENLDKPSYTYWKRESDKPFSEEFKPQNSDSQIAENSIVPAVRSAWNNAQTWEEKHLTKTQFEDYFNNLINTKNVNFKDTFTLEGVSSYSGDVNKYLN